MDIKEKYTLGNGISRAHVVLKRFFASNVAVQKLIAMGYSVLWKSNSLEIENAHVLGYPILNERVLETINSWNERFVPVGPDGKSIKKDDNFYLLLMPIELGVEIDILEWGFKQEKENGRK